MKRTTSLIQRAGMLILPAGLSLFSAVPPQLSAQNVMTVAGLPGVPITQEPHHHLVFQNSFVKEVRVVAAAVPSSIAWTPPHDGHDRLVVRLDKINDGSGPIEKNSSFPAGMLAWFPANTDLNVPNESDEERKLMILEFKDTPLKID